MRNAGPTCFTPPILDPGLPSFVAFTHPGGPYQPVLPSFPSEAALAAQPDVTLPPGFLLNLPPGDYGDVDVNDDGILTLTAGVYNLRSLRTGRNVTINTVGGTEVRIAVDFRSNNDLVIQGSDLARFYIRSDGLGPSTFSWTLGYNTLSDCATTIAVRGQFFVPNGRINLGDCTNIFGRVWADVIRNDTNINVTYRAPAALHGRKYLDADADGQIDPGESGLAGLTFYVDYDDDGVLDPGEPSAVSGADGSYVIDDVAAGTWTLRELEDPGFVCSFPGTCAYALTVTDGEVQGGFDFANWTGITKTGTKFEDLDADGSPREAGEPGLPGWTIFVDYDDDGVLDPGEPFGVTDAGGVYAIVNIAAGTWKVREVGRAGWMCSYPATTDVFGCYHEETFVPGTVYPGNDFGNWRDPLGHFQCYEIHRPSFDRAGVSLADALGPGTVTIKRAKRICAPADKNGEDPTAPLAPEHFTYYTLKQTSPFVKVKGVVVDNQFGPQRVTLTKPDRMLVPTAKSVAGPPAPLVRAIDHYKCYKVSGAKLKRAGIAVTDQFGSIVVDVKTPLHLCLPAIKDDEGPLVDPASALMCYKVNGLPPPVRPLLYTLNQFGPDVCDFFGPRDFCVPSTVTLP